jgi:predicted RNase H-like nuclease
LPASHRNAKAPIELVAWAVSSFSFDFSAAELTAQRGTPLQTEDGLLFLGIDGCPAGWYVARSSTDGGEVSGTVYERFSDVLAETHNGSIVTVDIPIGLRSVGNRRCDDAARRALGTKRGSSVFPAPLRSVLGAATHAEASAIRRGVEGKGMSIQSFAITRKVHEVDIALEQVPETSDRVYEVHPELCFASMNEGRPMQFGKKKREGRAERLAILTRVFGNAPDRLMSEHTRSRVGVDDVLDALVALWSAMRIGRGAAESLPSSPDRDERGRRMAIFF